MRPYAFIGLAGANIRHSNRSAFTRAELIATLGAIFICAVILLPSLASNGYRSEQVGCMNNLRQIGIAFQAWGNEHDDQRPWFVMTNIAQNQGGTREHPLMNNAWIHFTALSNFMSPTLLSDPGEMGRNKRVAQTWSFSPGDGFFNGNFRDNALSYMLGVHATVAESMGILTADRNVSFDGVSGCAYGFSQVLNLINSPSAFRGWTNGNHGTLGNVLLNDGRVEFTSSARLQAILGPVADVGAAEHFLVPFN
jgi:hypothetical protein